MSLRRWRDTLGPPLLAAAVVVVLLVPVVAGPAHSRAIGPEAVGPAPIGTSPSRPASRPPDVPTCRPNPRPASVEKAALVGAAWYRLDPVLDGRGGLHGQRLVVGRVGRGGGFEMPLAVESFASGPSAGRVLVGNDDGRRSTVRIVDVGARCAAMVYQGRDLVRRAVFDASGFGIVEFRVDRSSRADLGVWSRPPDGSKPRRILDPLAPNARIGRVFSTELSWSRDGRLIVTSCGELFCLARILDRSTGGVTTVDDPRVGEVLGLAGEDLVAYGGCPALPCEIVTTNVQTGRIRVLAELAGLATVSAVEGGAAVVFEDYGTDGRLRVVRLDGTVRRTLALGNGLRLVPASGRALAAIELPAGVIALAEGSRPSDEGAPATFINLADGRRLPAAEIVR